MELKKSGASTNTICNASTSIFSCATQPTPMSKLRNPRTKDQQKTQTSKGWALRSVLTLRYTVPSGDLYVQKPPRVFDRTDHLISHPLLTRLARNPSKFAFWRKIFFLLVRSATRLGRATPRSPPPETSPSSEEPLMSPRVIQPPLSEAALALLIVSALSMDKALLEGIAELVSVGEGVAEDAGNFTRSTSFMMAASSSIFEHRLIAVCRFDLLVLQLARLLIMRRHAPASSSALSIAVKLGRAANGSSLGFFSRNNKNPFFMQLNWTKALQEIAGGEHKISRGKSKQKQENKGPAAQQRGHQPEIATTAPES